MTAVPLWRASCVIAAIATGLQAIVLVASDTVRGAAVEIAIGDTLLFMVAGMAGFVAAGVHARQGWRAAALLLLAIAAAAAGGAYTTWAQSGEGGGLHRMLIGQAAWKTIALFALALPPALLAARGARAASLLALLGVALAAVGVALASPRAVAFDDTRALLGVAPFVAGCALVVAALAREAWAPHPAPPRPLPRWIFAGPLTLALAWALGGNLLVIIPLWILAPILLAMPALARWRARPTAALAAIALLTAGFVAPLGSCVFPNISDVIGPEPRATVEPVRLGELAGHGPYWVRSDLMGSGAVVCPAQSMIPAVLWLAALVAVAWIRWPEPEPLVRRLARASPPA